MQVTGINNYQNNNRINSFGAIKSIRCNGLFDPKNTTRHEECLDRILKNESLQQFANAHDLDLEIGVSYVASSMWDAYLNLRNITYKVGKIDSVGNVNLLYKFKSEIGGLDKGPSDTLNRLCQVFDSKASNLPDMYQKAFSELPIEERLSAQGIDLIIE